MPTMTTPQTDNAALAEQAANLFLQAFGNHPGFRLAHAKGIVCEGTFEAAPAASRIESRGAFQRQARPGDRAFLERHRSAPYSRRRSELQSQGHGHRFKLPGGGITDIVANGQNGFPAGTPADFVGFLGSFLATRPDSPKPTPFEQFLATHPNTARFLSTPNPSRPASPPTPISGTIASFS